MSQSVFRARTSRHASKSSTPSGRSSTRRPMTGGHRREARWRRRHGGNLRAPGWRRGRRGCRSRTRGTRRCRSAHDRDEHAAAADDHVGPRRLQAGVVDAVRERLGGERAEHVLDRVAGESEVVDASRSYSARPISTAATVVIVPARPTNVRACGHCRHLADDVVEPARRLGDGVGQLLGRGRVVLQVLLGQAHAADVDRDAPPRTRSVPTTNSVEPPPMSTTRNGPSRGSSSAVAPRNDERALLARR